jgi:hypothetical protein
VVNLGALPVVYYLNGNSIILIKKLILKETYIVKPVLKTTPEQQPPVNNDMPKPYPTKASTKLTL